IQAIGTPSTSAMPVADSDATRESLSAWRVSDSVSDLAASLHGARNSKPSNGRMKKATPSVAKAITATGTLCRLTGDQAWRKPKDSNVDWPADARTKAMNASATAEFFVPLTAATG